MTETVPEEVFPSDPSADSEPVATETPAETAPLDAAGPFAAVPGTTPGPKETTSSGSEATNPPAPSTAGPDAGRVPTQVVGIDSAVEQGNRVTLTTPNLETDPIGDLKARIRDHFENANRVVADLRAAANELEDLLTKVRAGL